MESRRIFVRGSFGKKLQFVDSVISGLPGAPGKQWENDHHNFTKKTFIKLHYVTVFGQDPKR